MKNSHIFFTIFLLLMALFTCRQTKVTEPVRLQGKTMGTTWHVTYWHPEAENYQKQIDSVLLAVNQSLSTYEGHSVISAVNKADSIAEVDAFMVKVYTAARSVAEHSGGAFDYTVMPLVNAWGFGFKNSESVDSLLIDSLKQFVGYDKVKLACNADSNSCHIVKALPGVMIDFSAIAKGFGVDVVAEFLERENIRNYLVEIGGELRTAGKNAEKNWTVGIDKPEENPEKREFKAIMQVSDLSVATSGNYRNFYVKDGKKYAHTIDPGTGYPALKDILSATVVSRKCMIADAYATAFMVVGVDRAMALAESVSGLEAYFIYRNEDDQIKTITTSGFKAVLADFEETD